MPVFKSDTSGWFRHEGAACFIYRINQKDPVALDTVIEALRSGELRSHPEGVPLIIDLAKSKYSIAELMDKLKSNCPDGILGRNKFVFLNESKILETAEKSRLKAGSWVYVVVSQDAINDAFDTTGIVAGIPAGTDRACYAAVMPHEEDSPFTPLPSPSLYKQHTLTPSTALASSTSANIRAGAEPLAAPAVVENAGCFSWLTAMLHRNRAPIHPDAGPGPT